MKSIVTVCIIPTTTMTFRKTPSAFIISSPAVHPHPHHHHSHAVAAAAAAGRSTSCTALNLGSALQVQQEMLLSTAIASSSSASAKEFEPILPDTTALAGIGAVLIVSAIAAWVWANQVVPTSRTKLAISKRRGGVKEYLDELELAAADDNDNDNNNNDNNNRQLERWLFTDWLEQRRNGTATRAGRQKEPALPVLKKAKWNSGDNPILAATALIMLGVIFTSITERIFS